MNHFEKGLNGPKKKMNNLISDIKLSTRYVRTKNINQAKRRTKKGWYTI